MKKLNTVFLLLFLLGWQINVHSQEQTPKSNLALVTDILDMNDIDTIIKHLLIQRTITEKQPTFVNRTRLGILYHDVAMKSFRRTRTEQKYYTEEAYRILTNLRNEQDLDESLLSIVRSFHASSLALLGAQRNNTELIDQAFSLFNQAIIDYGDYCYAPMYMRAKVAQQLPRNFAKLRLAKSDYSELIDKYGLNRNFANQRSMSYVYWAWAKLHQSKKDRAQAIRYLERAIELDPAGKGAGFRAKLLLEEMNTPLGNLEYDI